MVGVRTRGLAIVTVVGTVLFAAFLAPRAIAATPQFAPESAATVHPGIQVYTEGGQCTANFVFSDGTTTYLGQAAHCSSQGGQTQTDGCTTPSYPLGTPVEDANGQVIGTLAYNSWRAMQTAHETNPNACAANDLALIKLTATALSHTNPTLPHLGGPVGLDTNGAAAGDQVYAVGNSSLLLGLGSLTAQTGIVEANADNGWSHFVLMARPGVPGDSGSPYVDSAGRALGQLSTISVGTNGVGNTIGDLAKEISYAQAHGQPDLHVVPGTRAFNPLGLAG